MDVEQLLRTTLAEQAQEAPHATDTLFEDALAHRRSRRRRTAATAVSGLGVAALVMGVVVAGPRLMGSSTSGGAVATGSGGGGTALGMPGVDEQRAQWAAELGITDPPEVPVIRLVVPEEKQALVEDCMAREGFTLVEGAYVVPDEQKPAFDLAQYVCQVSYPIDPTRGGAWTDTQTAIQYEWTVDTVLPCLRALGYRVLGEVPTRQEFLDSWARDEPYYPFAHIAGKDSLSNEQWTSLERSCPQIAPTDLLYD